MIKIAERSQMRIAIGVPGSKNSSIRKGLWE